MVVIAHRLDDVAVCTSLAVLAAGRVAEAGPPLALLDRPAAHAHVPDIGPDPCPGAFAAMAAELGPAVEARVRALAAAAAVAATQGAPIGGA